MFPSQRGNFFKSSDLKSVNNPKEVSRVKSPPLGVSASQSNFLKSSLNSTVQVAYPHSRPSFTNNNKSSIFSNLEFSPKPSFFTYRSSTVDNGGFMKKLSSSSLPHGDAKNLGGNWNIQNLFSEFSPQLSDFSSAPPESKNDKNSRSVQYTNDKSLAHKVEDERKLVKRLCSQVSKSGKLCEEGDFMLRLFNERENLLKQRRGVGTRLILKEEEDELKKRYLPLFCARGKTLVGKSTDSFYFPNSFASPSELKKSEADPKGYCRYNTSVDMSEFSENEIFLRIRGENLIVVDGVKLLHNDLTSKAERSKYKNKKIGGARVTSVYVDLPKGVYAEHLMIARDFDGKLLLQESWNF